MVVNMLKPASKFLLFAFAIATCLSCVPDPASVAQSLIDQSIQAHGQELLQTHDIDFRFRDKHYSLQRGTNGYTYERSFLHAQDTITDRLNSNGSFERFINEQHVQLPDTLSLSYSNSLNSVMYFFQLPYVLNDPAANKRFKGPAVVQGRPHFVVEVTFDQQGGGTDFEDEFRYWFDAETLMMNYLAYQYHTNGGGVRFRVATNRKSYSDLWVQDYDNYAPRHKEISLDSLPRLWQLGELQKVSRIAKEEVRVFARN